MVALAAAAAVVAAAEARAGHAATPLAAAEVPRVTLPGAPALAPRFTSTLTEAMVYLGAAEEIFTSHNKPCILITERLTCYPFTLSFCVVAFPPLFVAVFIFAHQMCLVCVRGLVSLLICRSSLFSLLLTIIFLLTISPSFLHLFLLLFVLYCMLSFGKILLL